MNFGWRLIAIGALVAGLFGVLVLRLWFLQVTEVEASLEVAFEQRIRVVEVEAPRGDIFDNRGKELLAGTVATLRVVVDRKLIASVDEGFSEEEEFLIQNLSALLAIPASEIRQEFETRGPGGRFPLGDQITQSTGISVLENIEDFPGVTIEPVPFRIYPLIETAAHIVGYVGSPNDTDLERIDIDINDQVGKFGIEGSYDRLLRGTPGQIIYRVNAKGEILGVLEERPPQPGGSVITTIDLDTQRFVEETLISGVLLARQEEEPRLTEGQEIFRGAAVVLDVTDGSVIAMASVPAFDPSIFSDGRLSQDEWEGLAKKAVFNNFAIQGLFPPGSSFKVIVNALARQRRISPELEEEYKDVVDQEADPTLFFSDGELLFPNTPPLNDWKDGGHGLVDLSESLAQSVNTYYWSIALRIWLRRDVDWPENLLQDFARRLSFGDRTGIDLPFEQPGLVGDREWFQFNQQNQTGLVRKEGGWSGGDLMNIATGQGALSVTPVQMAVAYSALVNGGTVWEPRVVDSVRDSENNLLFTNVPSAADKIDFRPGLVDELKADLNRVVNSETGTGKKAFEGFCDDDVPDDECAALQEVGGKTGTAEIFQADEDADEIDTAWFVGAAPLSDPRWVVAVVIDQGGSGGKVAAPTARRILQYLMGENPDPVRAGSDSER
jgi:penicillin-binding protein 2